jgi:hypothetical protein
VVRILIYTLDILKDRDVSKNQKEDKMIEELIMPGKSRNTMENNKVLLAVTYNTNVYNYYNYTGNRIEYEYIADVLIGMVAADIISLNKSQNEILRANKGLCSHELEPAYQKSTVYQVITKSLFGKLDDNQNKNYDSKEALFFMATNILKPHLKTDFTKELILSDRLTSIERTELESLEKYNLYYNLLDIKSMIPFENAMKIINVKSAKCSLCDDFVSKGIYMII